MAQNDEFVIDVVTNFKSKGTKEVYDSFKILNKRIKELATGPISKEIAKNIKKEIDSITKEMKQSGVFNKGFDPHLQRVAIRRAEARISALRSPNRAYSRINNLVDDISTDFGRTVRSSLLDEREGNFTKTSNKLNKIVIREEKTRYNERAKNELKLEKMRQKGAKEERKALLETNRYNTLYNGMGNKLFRMFAYSVGLKTGLMGNKNSFFLNYAISRRDQDLFLDSNKTKINWSNLSYEKMVNDLSTLVSFTQEITTTVKTFYHDYLTNLGKRERYIKKAEKYYEKVLEEYNKTETDLAVWREGSRDVKTGTVGNITSSSLNYNLVKERYGENIARKIFTQGASTSLGVGGIMTQIYNELGISGARDTSTLALDFYQALNEGAITSNGNRIKLTQKQIQRISKHFEDSYMDLLERSVYGGYNQNSIVGVYGANNRNANTYARFSDVNFNADNAIDTIRERYRKQNELQMNSDINIQNKQMQSWNTFNDSLVNLYDMKLKNREDSFIKNLDNLSKQIASDFHSTFETVWGTISSTLPFVAASAVLYATGNPQWAYYTLQGSNIITKGILNPIAQSDFFQNNILRWNNQDSNNNNGLLR